MPASTSSKPTSRKPSSQKAAPAPYRIGRSKTGLGLFATQPIKKGVKIVRYFGPLLDSKNEKHDAIENKYLFQISKRWTVDGSIRKNIARYINHACKPNAESDVNVAKRRIVIRSIRKIAPGDEINYDYGTEYFKEYLKPIGCKCDACEAKRKKKRAAARAEKLKAKLKAERKALKKLEKDKAKKKDARAKALKSKAVKSKAVKSKAVKSKAVKSKASAPSKAIVAKSKAKVGTKTSTAPRKTKARAGKAKA